MHFAAASQRRAILSLLFLAIVPANGASADYFPPPDSAGGWRTLTDAAEIQRRAGIDIKKLDQAFAYAQRSSQHGGLLVVRHGWLVYERYYGKGNREAIPALASVGKAYTSIACGIMLRDSHDKIPDGLDQKVFNETYLPDALPLNDSRKADIKLGQLLSWRRGSTAKAAILASSILSPPSNSNRFHLPIRRHRWQTRTRLRCKHLCGPNPVVAILMLHHPLMLRPSSCAKSQAWRCKTISIRNWPNLWAGGVGAMRLTAMQAPCLTLREVATLPFAPLTRYASAIFCCIKVVGRSNNSCLRSTSPCVDVRRPIKSMPPSA